MCPTQTEFQSLPHRILFWICLIASTALKQSQLRIVNRHKVNNATQMGDQYLQHGDCTGEQ